MTFQQQIETYLSGLPAKWKDQLVQLLCLIKEQKQEPDCATVKSCETVTSLSDFTVNGTEISITYKDERGITVTRSFETSTIINDILGDLDPNCLTDQVTWDSLTFFQRLQLLIDKQCSCCSGSFAPRVFDTAIGDPIPCAGTASLRVDGFNIGTGVPVTISEPLSDVVSDLNSYYDGFATFVISEDGIETTMLTDGYEGIFLNFDLSCE